MVPFTLSLKPPQPISLDVNALENIRHFRREFSLTCSLTGLDKASEDVRLRFFYYTAGRAACSIIENLTTNMPEFEKRKVDSILSRLEEYFLPATQNNLLERLQFHKMTHHYDESLEAYVARIWQQAAKCRFESDADLMMRDRFLTGLQNDNLINYILSRSDCNASFNDVINLSKMWTAENEALRPMTPISVQICASPESTQGPILAVNIKKEPPPQEEESHIPMPMQIKEEKLFSYSTPVLPSPTVLTPVKLKPSPPSSPQPSIPSPPPPKVSQPLPPPPKPSQPLLPPPKPLQPLSQPLPSPQSSLPPPIASEKVVPPPETQIKLNVGTFIILKKDKENSVPVIWRVDGATLLEKYLPYRDGKFFRSSAQFRNWDQKAMNEYERVKTFYPKKEKTAQGEFTVVELEREIFEPSPPAKRKKKKVKR